MSVVFMHVGQAGNQIGAQIWPKLFEKDPGQFVNSFTLNNGTVKHTARGILIDSEPKVIQKCMETMPDLFRVKQNVLFNQGGRGNNWALGYSTDYKEVNKKSGFGKPNKSSVKSPSKISKAFAFDNESDDEKVLHEEAMELLRLQAEKADHFRGTLLFHSLAGGTGSGLGSRLIEDYKDVYQQKKHLVTCSIWPASCGETPLQQYNACLSLSSLQENADAILLFQNTELLRILSSSCSSDAHNFSMHNLNEYIASCMSHYLLSHQGMFDFAPLLVNCCPLNQFKIASMNTNPFNLNGKSKVTNSEFFQNNVDYNTLIDGLASQYPMAMNGKHKTLHLLAIAPSESGLNVDKLVQKYKPIAPDTISILDGVSKKSNQVTSIANRTQISEPLSEVCAQAKSKIEIGAYLHWYQKFGVERDQVQDAIYSVEDLAEQYDLLRHE